MVTVNPFYVEPIGSNKPGFSLKIFIGSTPYQFDYFYNPPSMEIEENRGFERGSCRFTITDYDPTSFNLPFIPAIDQKIEVWNYTENDLFFSGRIVEVQRNLIVRRDDGTEVMVYDIECTDLTIDFERILVAERYVGVTTGFIARDVIRRFTFFNYNLIDPLEGETVTDLRFNQEYVSSVLQRILELQPTWTFWYDATTREVYIGEAASIYNTVMNITESNVYEYFYPPTFQLDPDNTIVRNRVKFFYNSLYEVGTVSIAEGDTVVFGQGTDFSTYVKEGSSIRINNSESVYNVQRILSETELWISSPFQETTIVTGVPYQITGSPSLVVVQDSASIAAMALINGETGINAGVYEYKVPDDSSPYTRVQATAIAQSHLLRYSTPLISGKGESYNSQITLSSFHAGQTINFNLPTSRQVVADVIIQQLTKRDTGGLLERIDLVPGEDRVDPLLKYDLDFKDRIFDIRNQIKRLQIDIRRTTFDEDLIVWHDVQVPEMINIDDQVTLAEATYVTEELEIDDNIDFRTPPTAGPYYTNPTGNTAGYCIGRTQWGFAS
jgi:hypothetical protein